MDVSWLSVIVCVAVLIAVVLLTVTCLDCRNKGPLASIRQTPSDEYVPSNHFRVIHPSQPTTDVNSLYPPGSHLSPFTNPDSRPEWRPGPYPPSETESNPSYENPGPESLESDADDAGSGYIIVLPGGQDPVTNRSETSTPSSDTQHDYENVETQMSRSSTRSDNTDYLNVVPKHGPDYMSSVRGPQRPVSATTATSDSDNNGDDDDDDDDDDESGNYVNQQPMIHS